MKTRADYEKELVEIAKELYMLETRRCELSPYNDNLYSLRSQYTKTVDMVVSSTDEGLIQ